MEPGLGSAGIALLLLQLILSLSSVVLLQLLSKLEAFKMKPRLRYPDTPSLLVGIFTVGPGAGTSEGGSMAWVTYPVLSCHR